MGFERQGVWQEVDWAKHHKKDKLECLRASLTIGGASGLRRSRHIPQYILVPTLALKLPTIMHQLEKRRVQVTSQHNTFM